MYCIKQPSYGTYVDLSSRFEAALIPLSSSDDLKQAQEAFYAQFPKADHYPYAFRFEGLSRSSDDGEPSGTGGRALLGLLENKQIDCCLLIVARYFGGTKLGIPRLRRAFLGAGESAIASAKLYIKKPCYRYRIQCTYSEYSIIDKNAARMHCVIDETFFDVNVVAILHSFDRIDSSLEKMGLSLGLIESEEETLEYVEA